MHIFSLIKKAHAVIKRDAGKNKSGVFIDTRETGTYVTAAYNASVYAAVQWRGEGLPCFLSGEGLTALDDDFVRSAAKTSYKRIEADDEYSMCAEDNHELHALAGMVEHIDYEPLQEIHTLEGVEVFAPLTKSKGLRKLLEHRDNLKQAFIQGNLQCLTSGHWLVQKEINDGSAASVPFAVLEIMQSWGKTVEWIYASSSNHQVKFHGICAQGGAVTLCYYRPSAHAPDVTEIQQCYRPPSFFTLEPEALLHFVGKIGKSFGKDDLIYFTYDTSDGLELYLSSTNLTPDNEEVIQRDHTRYLDCVGYRLVDDNGFTKDGSFLIAWNAIYFTTCLSAVGNLIEFIVPIADDGSGNKPCAMIGEDADALVMPKRF